MSGMFPDASGIFRDIPQCLAVQGYSRVRQLRAVLECLPILRECCVFDRPNMSSTLRRPKRRHLGHDDLTSRLVADMSQTLLRPEVAKCEPAARVLSLSTMTSGFSKIGRVTSPSSWRELAYVSSVRETVSPKI